MLYTASGRRVQGRSSGHMPVCRSQYFAEDASVLGEPEAEIIPSSSQSPYGV